MPGPLLLTGCGGDRREQPTYPVSGEVRLDGAPLAGATLVFHPVDKSKFKWDERPQARTDESGKFTVFTYRSDDGAPAGDYRVAIAVLQGADAEGGDQVKRVKGSARIPGLYGNPETSGLKATVGTGPKSLPAFELSSKAK